MTSRRGVLAFAGLVALAQALFVWTTWLPAPSDGGDNAGYVSLAHALVSGDGYTETFDPERRPHTKYPPVFPVVLAGAIAAGATTWTALKTIPAAFTVAWVVLAYLWAARRRGPWFGLAVGLLTGVSNAVLWYSHWLLSEPPFLLFTFAALWAADAGSEGGPAGSAGSGGLADDGRRVDPGHPAWIVGAAAAAILAYFTRSAGLPLLVALGAWLALRRRWKPLAGYAVVAGVPALLWWLRSVGVGTSDYVREFWMVDPYQPALGTVGPGGLAARVGENLQGYVLAHLPFGVTGAAPGGGLAAILGLALVLTALVGWVRRATSRPGVAEIFLPLYAGLITLWPPVWSGDRFVLPLIPLVLFYGGEALLWLGEGVHRRGPAVAAAAAVLALGVPSGVYWIRSVPVSRECADMVRDGGAFACYGPEWEAFVEAARWSGANLPPGSAVLSRKPRIFYVMGGVPSRTYPFVGDPDALLEEARRVGARYVLLDHVSSQGPAAVGGAVGRRPEAFCPVRFFGPPGRETVLLGIVGEVSGGGAGVEREGEGRAGTGLPDCPPGLAPTTDAPLGPPGMTIPLLADGRRGATPSAR